MKKRLLDYIYSKRVPFLFRVLAIYACLIGIESLVMTVNMFYNADWIDKLTQTSLNYFLLPKIFIIVLNVPLLVPILAFASMAGLWKGKIWGVDVQIMFSMFVIGTTWAATYYFEDIYFIKERETFFIVLNIIIIIYLFIIGTIKDFSLEEI